jgi:hypothetical protein
MIPREEVVVSYFMGVALPIVPGLEERDTWWLDYLREVHGIDPRNWLADQPPPTPPLLVFEWKARA